MVRRGAPACAGAHKSDRITRRADFLRIQQAGSKIATPFFLALVLPGAQNDLPARFGFTVSSKVGTAVVRNRIRRRLRSIVRERQSYVPPGFDIVLIARHAAVAATWSQLCGAFLRLESHLGKQRP